MRYWKRVDSRGQTTTVESYSHDLPIIGAVEITEMEYQLYLDSLPRIPGATGATVKPGLWARVKGVFGRKQ